MSLSKKVTPGLTEWQTPSRTSLRFYMSSVYHHNATFFFRLVSIQMIWSWKGYLDLKRLWIWLQSSFHVWCYQFLGIQCFKWNWKKDCVYVFNCICIVISQVNLNLHPQPMFSDIHLLFFYIVNGQIYCRGKCHLCLCRCAECSLINNSLMFVQ